MKITALTRNKGGSYHRIVLPLTFFKGHEVHFVEEMMPEFFETDILWYHWGSKIAPWFISAMREKYGFKVIIDIDDSFKIPKNHIEYEKVTKFVTTVIRHVQIADFIVTTNHNLKKELSKYIHPDRIIVVPNRIPYGFQQFQLKDETLDDFLKPERKIKVGMVGSTTHYNDWLEIKGWIKSLVNSPVFKETSEFIIAGYRNDPFWNKLRQEFNNPLIKFVSGQPVENYIPIYDMDIMLCPLENNEFNTCKSDLKVAEAACHGSYCILDEIYTQLGDLHKFHTVVNKDKDWLNQVLSLIKDKESLYLLKKIATVNVISETDYIKQCVKPRMELLDKTVSQFKDYTIHSIMYSPDQMCEYKPYFNFVNTVEQKSYLFEYNPITQLIPNSEGKYVGCFSWKFPQKTGLTKYTIENILESENADVVSFCKPIPNYLKFTEQHHPGFLWRFELMCKKLGLKVKEPKNVIYSNFFVAKPHIYKEYLKVLKRAIYLLDTDKSIDAMAPCQYLSGLPSDKLKSFTGLEYYTYHTFLLERLFSIWTENQKNVSVKNYG